MSNAKLELFNALLEGDIDAIEDLPDFVNPATGSYILLSTKAEVGERDIKDKQTGEAGKDGQIKLQFQITSVLETTPTEAQLECVGNLTSQTLYGEFGVKQFKKLFGASVAALGFSGPGAMSQFLQALNNGVEFAATFQRRYGQETVVNGEKVPAPVYSDLKSIVLSTALEEAQG
jgi:hypothetical protein